MKKSSFLLLCIFPLFCFSEQFSYVKKEELCSKVSEILETGESIKGIVPTSPDIEGFDYLIISTKSGPDFEEIDIAD